MGKALSVDLRSRVVAAIDDGLSRREAATRFGVGVSSAIRWYAAFRASGDVAPRAQGGDKRSHRIEAYRDDILSLVEEAPDITLSEIADHLHKAHGVRVASSTVWRFLDRHAMTFKKNRARRRAGAP